MIVFAGDSDVATDDRLDRLTKLPPSAKLAYKTLEYEGDLTQQALVKSSRLPSRTARDALDQLQEADLVSEEVYIPDARKRLYRRLPVTVDER